MIEPGSGRRPARLRRPCAARGRFRFRSRHPTGSVMMNLAPSAQTIGSTRSAKSRVHNGFEWKIECPRPDWTFYKFVVFPESGGLFIKSVHKNSSHADNFCCRNDSRESVLQKVSSETPPKWILVARQSADDGNRNLVRQALNPLHLGRQSASFYASSCNAVVANNDNTGCLLICAT